MSMVNEMNSQKFQSGAIGIAFACTQVNLGERGLGEIEKAEED